MSKISETSFTLDRNKDDPNRVVWDGAQLILKYGVEKYATSAFKTLATEYNIKIDDAINKNTSELMQQVSHKAELHKLIDSDSEEDAEDEDEDDAVEEEEKGEEEFVKKKEVNSIVSIDTKDVAKQ